MIRIEKPLSYYFPQLKLTLENFYELIVEFDKIDGLNQYHANYLFLKSVIEKFANKHYKNVQTNVPFEIVHNIHNIPFDLYSPNTVDFDQKWKNTIDVLLSNESQQHALQLIYSEINNHNIPGVARFPEGYMLNELFKLHEFRSNKRTLKYAFWLSDDVVFNSFTDYFGRESTIELIQFINSNRHTLDGFEPYFLNNPNLDLTLKFEIITDFAYNNKVVSLIQVK